MRHRFTKVLLGVAVFTLLAGTASVAARSHRASASYNIGFIYPRTGILGAYGAEELEGFKYGLKYATKGTGKVNGKTLNITYQDDKGDAGDGRHRGEEPDRPGGQDPDGHGLIGCRRADGGNRRAEPGAVHLRPRCRRCDHGHQQVHLPRRPADDPGRARRQVVPRQGHRQEGRRLRPGQRLRARQLRRREGVLHRSQRLRGLGAADRDRLHAVRPAGQERESGSDLRRLGRARPPARCGRRSTSRTCSRGRRS